MKKYKPTKSSLFLLELMINLFLFTVLVTFCMQLFFKVYTFSKDTTLRYRAITACTSIAEVYQNSPYDMDLLMTIYPEALILNDTILIYFDSKFTACSEFDSVYRVFLTTNQEDNQLNIRFLRKNDTSVIYELTVSTYAPSTLNTLMGGSHP